MTQRAKVAVVGLGPMGGAIAGRLADRGRDVVGVDLDAARAAVWRDATGGQSVSALDQVGWHKIRCVFLAVRTPSQVEAVLMDDQVRTAMTDGASAFIVTTLTPADASGIAQRYSDWRVMELPVSGGITKARHGELTGLMAGPVLDAFETALLDDIFAELVVLGRVGQPSLLKLINNSLAAHNLLGAAVALETAHEHGLDAVVARDAIVASSGSSVTGDALARLTSNDADLLLKDARLLIQELNVSPFEGVLFNSLPERFGKAHGLLEGILPKGTQL